MKKYTKIWFLISILIISGNIYSQTLKRVLIIHSSPSFTLQINGNFNEGMGQLAGTYNADFQSDQFVLGRNFGATKGYGFDVISKIKLDEIGHFRFLSSFFYNRMGTYLFGNKTTIADKGHSTFNVFSLGFGLENNFTPNHKIKVYVGLQPIFSIISGNVTLSSYTYSSGVIQYLDSTYDVHIKPAFRIGGVLTGGMEYMMSETFGVNIGFNFMHANLLLKSANDSGDPANINLIDEESSSLPQYAGKKNFIIMNFTAGVCLYWGNPEKRYIISQK